MELTIRVEQPVDSAAIGEVLRAAFGGEAEARLVDALRESGDVRLSLVAESAGCVVGQILFSQMGIDGDGQSVEALALAPMAVLPSYQRQGIGSSLVRRGLELCAAAGHNIVLVVGHPEFYPRFGFSREHAARLESPYQGDAFMALELVPGALNGVTGRVRYARPFESL
ncbi:MAG: GNAT family N-acetyltransferase [Planctomycetaceae bacterium]